MDVSSESESETETTSSSETESNSTDEDGKNKYFVPICMVKKINYFIRMFYFGIVWHANWNVRNCYTCMFIWMLIFFPHCKLVDTCILIIFVRNANLLHPNYLVQELATFLYLTNEMLFVYWNLHNFTSRHNWWAWCMNSVALLQESGWKSMIFIFIYFINLPIRLSR